MNVPVVGLSEVRRLPRLGKIRLGIKVKSEKTGKEHPQAVDYFVCPPQVQAVYEERPLSLPVFLPSNEIEDNLSVYLKRYGSTRGLVCKGNGETAGCVSMETGEIIEVPCRYKQCEHYLAKPQRCKEIGVLSFLLPEVPDLGVWQIATSSYNSIVNLQSEMALAKRVCGGKLAGIPFQLTLEPQDAQVNGAKKTIYVLHLRTNITLSELRALPPFEPVAAAALPPGDDMPEELYPEIEVQEAELLAKEPIVNPPADGIKPLNANGNGNSQLPEQRQVHIEATARGLTKEGCQEWLNGTFHTRHTSELPKEDCLAAIAAVKRLTEAQVGGYNRVGASRKVANLPFGEGLKGA